MSVHKITFTFEPEFYQKISLKAKKGGYKNIQQYAYDLLHHVVYGKKKAGGRTKKIGYDDQLAKMMGRPTRESKKRVAWAKKVGLWN